MVVSSNCCGAVFDEAQDGHTTRAITFCASAQAEQSEAEAVQVTILNKHEAARSSAWEQTSL